jgi:hypothetical protein
MIYRVAPQKVAHFRTGVLGTAYLQFLITYLCIWSYDVIISYFSGVNKFFLHK